MTTAREEAAQLAPGNVKWLLRKLYRLVLRLVPEGRAGDKFISLFTFFRAHRRLPTAKPLFNDVLYRIKTTDEIIDPLRVFVSDKEFVKLYVKGIVGDKFNVPTIMVLRTIEEARDYRFPPACCVKPTHLSGKVILRRESEAIDFEEIETWFKSNYYHVNREANYRTLKPKIIVEPLVFDSDNLVDYKIFCCGDRKPNVIQVDVDRKIGHTRKFFDADWNELPFSLLYPRSLRRVDRPENLDLMLTVAGALGRHFTFVRVDLYSNGKECLVGEITNCHGNAWERFIPESAETTASNLIFGTTI